MKCCGERQGLSASDLSNKDVLVFWTENWQVYLQVYLALHCCAQASPPKSLRSACNYIWAHTFCGQWNSFHSTFRDWASPWSLYLSPQSSQLTRTANQAVSSFCFIPAWFACHGMPQTRFGDSYNNFFQIKVFPPTMSSFLSSIATNLYLVIYFAISRGNGCAQGTPLGNTLYQGSIYKYFMKG